MGALFFESPAEWRQWLEINHAIVNELWVGFYKKESGRLSLTWPESVDEALCFGWIDGVRKRLDENSYAIRFTPRKARSIWSQVNIDKAEAQIRMGRMQPSGLAAFQVRIQERSRIYSYEQENHGLNDEYIAQFQKNEKAWTFFQAQAPGYRRAASWWVISAKKEETRLKRLATLIDDSEQGRMIAPLLRPAKPQG
jgi:uncharacterized protein YdeI (YjbR/CyaY-like superfamily)